MTTPKAEDIIVQCCVCKVIKLDDGTWSDQPHHYKSDNYNISHGYCCNCYKEVMSSFKSTKTKLDAIVAKEESKAYNEAVK